MKIADITDPSTLYTPISVSVAVLDRITPEQKERVTQLLDSYSDCGFVQLRTDSWMKDAILFGLFTRQGGDCILSGLIESDGSSHT